MLGGYHTVTVIILQIYVIVAAEKSLTHVDISVNKMSISRGNFFTGTNMKAKKTKKGMCRGIWPYKAGEPARTVI